MKYLALLFAFAQANAMIMPMDGPIGFPRQQPMGPLFVPPPIVLPGNTNSLDSFKNSPQIFMNIFQSDPNSSNPSNAVQEDQIHRIHSEMSRMDFQRMSTENGIRQLQLENDRLRQQLRDQQQKPQNPQIPQMPGGCGCSMTGPNPPCCTVDAPNTSPNTSGPVGHPGQMPGPPQMPAVVTGQAVPSSGPVAQHIDPRQHVPGPPQVPAVVTGQAVPSSGPKDPAPPNAPQLHWVTHHPPAHLRPGSPAQQQKPETAQSFEPAQLQKQQPHPSSGPVSQHVDPRHQMPGPPQVPAVATAQAIPSSGPPSPNAPQMHWVTQPPAHHRGAQQH